MPASPQLHVFKIPIRVLVSKDEEGEGEHWEFVFEEAGKADEEKMNTEKTIKADQTYGTLPSAGEGKKDA